MAADNNTEVIPTELLSAQLTQLNERGRMHATRLWQLPFAYTGFIALIISSDSVTEHPQRDLLGWFLLVTGFTVLWCMYGAYEGISKAVEDIRAVEKVANLKITALKSASRLALHFVPYFTLVIIDLILVFLLALKFI